MRTQNRMWILFLIPTSEENTWKSLKCSSCLVDLLLFDKSSSTCALLISAPHDRTLLNYVTCVVKDHGCCLCRCLGICLHILVALWKANIRPLLNSSQRTYCGFLCSTTQAVIWETLKVLFVATQVENDSWLSRRIAMFCILRLQVILVKSTMCPSNNKFSIADIVSEGIQESKEAGDPSRHLVVQHHPLPIFFSVSCTHSFFFTDTYTTCTVMNASFRNTNKVCASTLQALQFPP